MEGRNGSDQGLQVIGVLISGPLFYGIIGWIVDQYLGSTLWFPVGLVVGVALAGYLVVRRHGNRS